MTNEELIRFIEQHKIIAIVRGVESAKCMKVADALYEGGIRLMEITYNQSAPESWEATAGAIADIAKIFAKKFVWTWQDDNRPFGMAMLQLGKKIGEKVLDNTDQESMAKAIVKREFNGIGIDPNKNYAQPSSKAMLIDHAWQSIQTAGFFWYFVIMLLATASAIWNRKRNTLNIAYMWVCLFVLGYWGAMVISESASRYKCLVMPYVFIIMAPLVTNIIFRGKELQ